MSDRKPKIIKRSELERRAQQQRRAEITLLRLLVEKMPDEAKRIVQNLHNAPTRNLIDNTL